MDDHDVHTTLNHLPTNKDVHPKTIFLNQREWLEEKNKGMRDEPPCERKPQEISPLKYDFVPNKGDSYI